MANTKQRWTAPWWMKPYLGFIVNTGGNDVEEMVNGNADPRINLPLSTLQACVKSQISLLQSLHDKGILTCANCRGTGQITYSHGYQGSELGQRECPACRGRGVS